MKVCHTETMDMKFLLCVLSFCSFNYNRIKKDEGQGVKCHTQTMMHSEANETFIFIMNDR